MCYSHTLICKKKKKKTIPAKYPRIAYAPRETWGEGRREGKDEERMIELRSSCSTYRSRDSPRDEFFHDFIVNRAKGKKTLRRR